MLSVSVIVSIAIILTYLQDRVVGNKIRLNFFLVATVLLIGFFGIRVDYGNDYQSYRDIFDFFANHDFATAAYGDIMASGHNVERGWALLNYFFAPLGWHFFLFTLTVVQFGTIYWFLKKYVPPRYLWVALGFYLLNPALMLTELSMLRQSLAMSICLWIVPCIIQKKWIRAAIVIFLATFIHASCLCMLITLLFPYLSIKRPLLWILWFLGIIIALRIIDSLAGDIITFFLQSKALEVYEGYMDKDIKATGSGVVVALQIVIALFLLWTTKKNKADSHQYPFFILSYCAAMIMVQFAYTVVLSMRLSAYFTQLSLITYVPLSQYAKRNILATIMLLLIFGATVYSFIGHFSSETYGEFYSVYHTLLD